ncbi:MAG TPA: class I SAM-dependent methyltransferase [Candidatus Binataceae bacterium]|nr:class I SAM-dependent methyltransferase [Candidatus Binataceae bacterium]
MKIDMDAGVQSRGFLDSAELYDAIYHYKNYARECAHLRGLIEAAVPQARGVLDVACGTGAHAQFLKDHFAVDGIDLNEDYLRAARRKNPAGNYSRADMTGFDLGRTYDAVTCLFSAIGYVATALRLNCAIAAMARHVRPGGVLIVEPWLTPEAWKPGAQFINTGQLSDGLVCRMSYSGREGNISTSQLHYLRGSVRGIEHFSERMELALFTREEMTRAFEDAAMEVSYDAEGLMGRGLYLARHRA